MIATRLLKVTFSSYLTLTALASLDSNPIEEMEAKFFNSQAAFRRWLEKNHDKRTELLVGFHKKSGGKQTLSYPEALD